MVAASDLRARLNGLKKTKVNLEIAKIMPNSTTIHALITGGASGLGYATAEAVIKNDGKVAILNTNKATGEQAAKQLGENALFIETDVCDEQQVQ